MRVPVTLPAPHRLRHLLVSVLLAAGPFAVAKGPEPPLRLTLASLGVQPLNGVPLAASGTLTTVHFIDEQHLLLTFNVRRLLKRMPDCPEDDEDRTIKAIVVRLPAGKVVAETEWRLHDTRRYLWELGRGRFLLRIRDQLTTIAPLANLGSAEPFAEQPFLRSERRVQAILLSADGDLAAVETVPRPEPKTKDDPAQPQHALAKRPMTQINFYRLVQPDQPGGRMLVQSSGLAVAKAAVDLPIGPAGYIEVSQESTNRWLFDFDAYDGKYIELAPFDSTCRPRPIFVSVSEFVAFGCMGNSDHLAIGGFNLRGEQMWQQNFTDAQAFPNFSFAPEGGRFALSRNIVASTAGITVDFAPSSFTTQEIRVYQAYSGKQLLRVEALPVQQNGQNYDLSPEGRALAVLRDGAIEIHHLPPMTRTEEAEMRASRALAPKDMGLNVNLIPHDRPDLAPKLAAIKVNAAMQAASAAVSVTPPVAPPLPNPPQAISGDAPPSAEEPRKAPTLYTLPTDKPAQK